MAFASAAIEQRNQEATLWVGGLEDRVDDDLVWELFIQAGPLVSVHMPLDKVSGRHGGYAFVEFRTPEDAEYAMKLMNTVKLYGKSIITRKAGDNKATTTEVGANLFIGNLAPEVDEAALYQTFSAFGTISSTRIQRDTDSGESKGFGFVSYDAFESSDAAIAAMNGQYIAGRPIVAQYAFRKDAKGERHGSQAERLLAASLRSTSGKVNTHFAAAPGQMISTAPGVAPMLGQAADSSGAAPPMLPPTAILPSSMLQPPPLPGMPSSSAALLPPPVPGMGRGVDMTRPAWMTMAGPLQPGGLHMGMVGTVPGAGGALMPPPPPPPGMAAVGGLLGAGGPPPVPGYPPGMLPPPVPGMYPPPVPAGPGMAMYGAPGVPPMAY